MWGTSTNHQTCTERFLDSVLADHPMCVDFCLDFFAEINA